MRSILVRSTILGILFLAQIQYIIFIEFMSEKQSNYQQNRPKLTNKKDFMRFYQENQKSLSLYQSQLHDEDIKTILEAGLCINVLWLSINNLTELGAEYLSKGKLPLTEIYIGWNQLGPVGTRFLSIAPWPRLKKIWIVHNNIGPTGAKYLSQGDWKQLEEINVGHNQIEDGGCNYLMKANWKKLTKLWLSQNNITSNGIRMLAKANSMKVTNVSLWSNSVDDKGCFTLQQVDWQNLKTLNLLRNKIEGYEVDAIRKMFNSKFKADLQLDV